MRQGSAKKSIVETIVKIGSLSLLALAAVSPAAAQDGRGRSGTAKITSTPDGESGVTVKRSGRRPARRFVETEPRTEQPAIGTLAVMINEGGSRLELARSDESTNTEVIQNSSKASALIIRTLPVGTYSIKAIKEGYFETVRSVEVEKGQRRRVEMILRPKMAILSVSTNVKDATINIEKIGSFTGGVHKAFVPPGSYRVTAMRRGYQSRQGTVELRSPGSEEFLKMILEPLRIDAVLDLAAEKLNGLNFAEAEALTNDVLILNPEHARANLILGLIGYGRGKSDSITFFRKAIRNGEVARFPVKIAVEPARSKLADAELLIDRDGIEINSRQQADLNFTIKRPNITEVSRSDDAGNSVFAALNGKSDFYGRPIEPKLKIYSSNATIGPDAGIRCSTDAAGRSCGSDIAILTQLLTAWRTDPEMSR